MIDDALLSVINNRTIYTPIAPKKSNQIKIIYTL